MHVEVGKHIWNAFVFVNFPTDIATWLSADFLSETTKHGFFKFCYAKSPDASSILPLKNLMMQWIVHVNLAIWGSRHNSDCHKSSKADELDFAFVLWSLYMKNIPTPTAHDEHEKENITEYFDRKNWNHKWRGDFFS